MRGEQIDGIPPGLCPHQCRQLRLVAGLEARYKFHQQIDCHILALALIKRPQGLRHGEQPVRIRSLAQTRESGLHRCAPQRRGNAEIREALLHVSRHRPRPCRIGLCGQQLMQIPGEQIRSM